MKHFKQHALKPLLTIVALLCVGFSSFAWNTYTINNTSGNSTIATLSWDASSKCYKGTIPGGNNEKYFNVKTTDSATGYFGITDGSNYYVFNKTIIPANLTKDANAIYLETSAELDVVVYTQDDKQGYNPRAIAFYPKLGLGGINGNWSYQNSEKLNSGAGYKTYTVEDSTDDQYFSFYSSDNKQLSCYNSGVLIDGPQMTATESTNACKIVKNSGKLEISVISVDFSNNKHEVVFTVKSTSQGGGGEITSGNIFLVTSKPGNGNGATDKQMVAMEQTSDKVYEYTITDYNGGDLYLYVQEKDNSGNVIKTYGSNNTDHGGSGMDNREDIQKGNSKNMTYHNGNVDAGYKYNNSGEIHVKVDFNKSPATFEILQEIVDLPEKAYYLIGDINDWFSNSFCSCSKKERNDTNGTHKKYHENNNNSSDMYSASWYFIDHKDENDKDMDNSATRELWKLKPEYNEDGSVKCYTYATPLLYGQFKIFGGSWNDENTWFSHATYGSSDFDTYWKGVLKTTEDYESGEAISVETGWNRQNIHLNHNAYKEAVIRFYPDTKKIELQGVPVDYYIFYYPSLDRKKASKSITAFIDSDNPNGNNYYLPYLNTADWSQTEQHMNHSAGWNMEKADITTAEMAQKLFPYDEEARKNLMEGILPNGYRIPKTDGENFDEIFYAPIPRGFERAPGTPFQVHFTGQEGISSAARQAIANDHIYVFDGVHVHANTEKMYSSAYDLDLTVEYRVYGQDGDYHTYVLLEDGTTKNVSANDTETGWMTLDTKSNSNNANHWWTMDDNLKASDGEKVAGRDWMFHKINNENSSKDYRHEIAPEYANAFVQFRVDLKVYGKNNVPAKAGAQSDPGYAWKGLVPTKFEFYESQGAHPLKGNELYQVLSADDPVFTGIEEIFGDEEWNDEEMNGDAAEPVYYNLQGVRIANPTKGLYIKVSGNKSEKVLF